MPLNLPEVYADSDVNNIAKVLNLGFILLPAFLLIVLARQLIETDYDIALIIVGGITISFYCRYQFLNGYLNKSVITVSVLFTILLTGLCTLGNGVHDIGLIGFPIIIGFSSIILDFRQLLLTSALSLLGLTWLVLGEIGGLYTPITASSGTIGDFIISSLLIALGGIVAFGLTNNMKASLKRAHHEVELSQSGSKKLASEIEAKNEIITETHRAVLNSLTYIRHLIDFKQNGTLELTPTYASIQRKILVIECAHQILLDIRAPIILDLKLLVQLILKRYEKQLSTKVLHMDLDTNSSTTSLDEAINFGICMLELVHAADISDCETLHLKLSMDNDKVDFSINGVNEQNIADDPGIVINLLTKQLKGTLKQEENKITLSFIKTKSNEVF